MKLGYSPVTVACVCVRGWAEKGHMTKRTVDELLPKLATIEITELISVNIFQLVNELLNEILLLKKQQCGCM